MSPPLPLVLLLLTIPVISHSQTVPVRIGDYVRFAPQDSAAAGLWREGTLLTASRRGVLVRPAGSRSDTLPVMFERSVRMQRLQWPNAPLWLGGWIGSATGAVLGATVLGSTFPPTWRDQVGGNAAEAFAFGVLGGLIGIGVGLAVRSQQWEEIEIPPGGFAITPLSRPAPATRVPLSKTERWREFEATEINFAEFFTAWKDSLRPVEGVWEIDRSQSRMFQPWPHGVRLPRRVAIIRDQRYEGYDYIAVELPPRGGGFRPGYYAQIRFALRPLEEPGFFDIRFVPTGGRGRVSKVELFEDWWLEFQFTGSSDILVWDKLAIRMP